MKDHATIKSGREMAGQTVAVEEALGGTRGVFRIKYADWKSLMYQELGVEDANMFKQVLRRVRKQLDQVPNTAPRYSPRDSHRQVISFLQNHKLKEHFIPSLVPVRRHDLPRGTSLQPMEPVIFQLMSRPLSTFEVGRSP